MKTAEIAKVLLEIRRRPSPFVMNGELLLLLGPDGFQEALNRRWLIQDSENGAMLITNQQAFIEQMKQLVEVDVAETEPEVGDSVYVAADGKTYEATVQSRDGDAYSLSFQPGKAPNSAVRAYKRAELKKYARPDQKLQPGSVPVQSQAGPAPATGVPFNPVLTNHIPR